MGRYQIFMGLSACVSQLCDTNKANEFTEIIESAGHV
mgnify:FL=1